MNEADVKTEGTTEKNDSLGKFNVYLAESDRGTLIRLLSRGLDYYTAKDMVYCLNAGNKNPQVIYLFDNLD